MYSIAFKLPSLTKSVALILKPLDSTRFTEFAYIQKFIWEKKLKDMKVLDVSSPHLIAYALAKDNNVVKTNIDLWEKGFINESKNLTFEVADATDLKYPDNQFDLTYSISVIEHIFEGSTKALQEMVRVTKPGGFIYASFPMAEEHKEEWTEHAAYPDQKKYKDGYFFQYRFSQSDVEKMLQSLGTIHVVSRDTLWEKKTGSYDTMIRRLRASTGSSILNFAKNAILVWYYGLTLFENRGSDTAPNKEAFGNIHIILQK